VPGFDKGFAQPLIERGDAAGAQRMGRPKYNDALCGFAHAAAKITETGLTNICNTQTAQWLR
jgi:L-fucose isomerase-like protein